MKTKTLTLLAISLSLNSFAQQKDIDKQEQIKNAPDVYIQSGGQIHDGLLRTPSRNMEKISDPNGQFVIYRNTDDSDGFKKGLMILNKSENQNSYDYMNKKERFFQANPEIKNAEENHIPQTREDIK